MRVTEESFIGGILGSETVISSPSIHAPGIGTIIDMASHMTFNISYFASI